MWYSSIKARLSENDDNYSKDFCNCTVANVQPTFSIDVSTSFVPGVSASVLPGGTTVHSLALSMS